MAVWREIISISMGPYPHPLPNTYLSDRHTHTHTHPHPHTDSWYHPPAHTHPHTHTHPPSSKVEIWHNSAVLVDRSAVSVSGHLPVDSKVSTTSKGVPVRLKLPSRYFFFAAPLPPVAATVCVCVCVCLMFVDPSVAAASHTI